MPTRPRPRPCSGRCRDAGINFFDCANVYAGGRSEEILGRLMAGSRDELVITSKVDFPVGPGANQRGLSRRHIPRRSRAASAGWATDRIDLYFVHGFDPLTPMDETLRALDDLVHGGKVLYIGVSNWAAWQIAKALGLSALHELARFECIQPMYSLVKRQAEVEILPLAASEGLGVISYSPLGGGLLSGKYGADVRPEGGRLQENPVYARRYGDGGLLRDRGSFRGARAGARRAPGGVGRGMGHGAPGDHRADHRRAQPGSSWRRRWERRPWR